jgi:hypothetical protein
MNLLAALLLAFPPVETAFWLLNFLRPEARNHAG